MQFSLQVMEEVPRGMIEPVERLSQFEYNARLAKTFRHVGVHIPTNIGVNESHSVSC
jgi:hypothetical protein